MAIVRDSKSQILLSFQHILTERQKAESKVATKAEEFQPARNQEIVAKAATYTIDTIVKGMAELQLEFGTIITGLSDRLTTEVDKLEAAKQAIAIETAHLLELQRIRIVADALHILTQEHQEHLQNIERQSIEHRETLSIEQNVIKKAWQQQEKEYTEQQAEIAANLGKERQQEEDEYQYKYTRERQQEIDNYTATKRAQDREIQERDRELQKEWKKREKFLQDNQKIWEQNQAKVTAFPTELEEAVKKAREEAIREISNDAKIKADLFEKEWEGSKQGYELKIQSLEQVVERQSQQISELTAQLQAVMNQSQSLALKAFETSSLSH
jgi:hypothetical protein